MPGQDALEGVVPAGDPGAGQAFQFEVELDPLGQAELVFYQEDLGFIHGGLLQVPVC